MADPKDVKAETLVNPNERANSVAAQEAQKVYEALKQSREAENLQDAILAALKAKEANKKNE